MLPPLFVWVCCRSDCNRSNGSRLDRGFVRDQPVSQFVYALRALAGDSTPAAAAVTWPVIDSGADLVGGLYRDSGSAARSRFLEAAMMSVASQDKRTDAFWAFGDVRPAGSRRGSENSPRRLVAHTWVLTGRVTRSVASRPCDPGRVLDHACRAVSDSEHRFGRRCFAAHRAQRSVWQCPADRDGRGHVRARWSAESVSCVNAVTACFPDCGSLPVHRASGLLSRLVADVLRIVVTTAVIMCAGFVLGFRFRQGILASMAWLFVPTVFGVAFTMAVITLALYAANTIVVEATEIVWGVLMFFSTGFVPVNQYPRWLQPIVAASADKLCRRGDARTVAWWSGAGTDGQDVAVVGGHRRRVRNTDGYRIPKGQHPWMNRGPPGGLRLFSSSVIRNLSRSEEIFAETECFVGVGAHLQGPIDVEALSAAFDALLEAHPVLGGHLEQSPDGRHQIAVDDLLHPGIEVVEIHDPAAESPRCPPRPKRVASSSAVDHARQRRAADSLCPSRPCRRSPRVPARRGNVLLLHRSGVQRKHRAGQRPSRAGAARSCARQRGIQKQQRSGLERFMPAMFAYDLPPSRRAASDVTPASPLRVPMAACQLSERETHDLMAFGRARQVGLNGLLSAALLLAEWRFVAGRISRCPMSIRSISLRPLTPAVCHRMHKPLGSGHLSCRDRPQHRCGKPRPGHRRDFSSRSVRWA